MPLFLEKPGVWYLLEFALSSEQLTMEIKDFLFTPAPATPPHQHLCSNPVMESSKKPSIAEWYQTLLQITGKESDKGTSKPELRSQG